MLTHGFKIRSAHVSMEIWKIVALDQVRFKIKKQYLSTKFNTKKVAQDLPFLKKGNAKNFYKSTPNPQILGGSLAGWQFPNVHLEKPKGWRITSRINSLNSFCYRSSQTFTVDTSR